MEITWYGNNLVKLSEKGLATLVTNPVGALPAGWKTEIAAISQPEETLVTRPGIRQVLQRPGEYEIGGVFITALSADAPVPEQPARRLMFGFDFGGLSVIFPGPLEKAPAQATLEKLGTPHILLLSLGSGISPTKAAELVRQLEPKLVIPLYSTLEELKKFSKELGLEEPGALPVLKTAITSLPEETRFVVLAEQNIS
jgi:hypothetical protein